MTTTTNPEALAWKHNYTAGISCKQNQAGAFDIVGWPESLPAPTQADVDQWEAEYAARDKKAELYDREVQRDPLLIAFIKCLNDASFVPGQNYTLANIKQILKSKL